MNDCLSCSTCRRQRGCTRVGPSKKYFLSSFELKKKLLFTHWLFSFLSLFLSPYLPASLTSSYPPSLLSLFLPSVLVQWRKIKHNKIICNMRIHINAKGENYQGQTLRNLCQNVFCMDSKQLDSGCRKCVFPSILDSLNAVASPMPNQIGVQSNRKVHRGLSLIHYNR